MPDAQALQLLQKSGALQDPGMAAFVQQHGPSVALAASQGHGSYVPENIAEAGWQQQYNAMPWYEKAAVGVGKGLEDSYGALKGSALTLGNKIGLVPSSTLGAYRQSVAKSNNDIAPITNAVARSNPQSSFLWQYAGQNTPALAAGVVGGAFGAAPELGETLGMTGLPLAASRVGIGALEGGLYGAATPTQDQNYTRNMAIGATLGGLMPVGIGALKYGWGAAKNVAQFLGGEASRESLAGAVLKDAVNAPIDASATPAVSGFKPTVGQLTNAPGAVQLERALRAKGDLGASLTTQEQANNAALHQAFGAVAPEVPPQDASATARDALESAKSAAKGAEAKAWGQIPDGAVFSTQAMKKAVGNTLGALPKAYRALVPEEIPSLMDALGDNETLPELQAARSRIGELATQARVGGDANKARILGEIQSHVDSAIDPTNAALGDGVTPEQFQGAYNDAMQSSRDLHARFDRKPISNALKQTATGPAVPPSNTLQTILRNGTPEAVSQLSSAIGNNPEGRQAVRDYLVNAMRQYGGTAAQDQFGNPMLSGAKLGKFLGDHNAALDEFLEPQQRDAINQIVNAAKMNDNVMRGAARVGGSDTANKINQGNVLASLTKAKGILGLAGLPGDIVNFGIGKVAGGAQYKLDAILTRAMSDPEYADMLMQRATPGNLQRIMSHVARVPKGLAPGLGAHYLVTGGNEPTTTGTPWIGAPPVLLGSGQ
ncbi:MAG: hypothetical protein KGL35_22765 [Bradyrhizobium sp.]|nr:hypothetical protein [Bradyrhizobium sp.]